MAEDTDEEAKKLLANETDLTSMPKEIPTRPHGNMDDAVEKAEDYTD